MRTTMYAPRKNQFIEKRILAYINISRCKNFLAQLKRIKNKRTKKTFTAAFREFLSSSRPRFFSDCRSHPMRCPNDGPASRNCTKHYPGSLPGVLSRVLPRDPSLCIYRRGYLRAPPRLLITISTTVFYRENGGRYLENKRQNVSA